MAVQLICNESITLNAGGFPECPSGWVQQIYTLPFDISQLTPELVLSAYTGGFVLFATPYVATIGIRHLLSFLK